MEIKVGNGTETGYRGLGCGVLGGFKGLSSRLQAFHPPLAHTA